VSSDVDSVEGVGVDGGSVSGRTRFSVLADEYNVLL
jgi:hypothetical protein